jgi:hypothetical protein
MFQVYPKVNRYIQNRLRLSVILVGQLSSLVFHALSARQEGQPNRVWTQFSLVSGGIGLFL